MRGMGSRPLLPREPDPTLAPETELKLSLSLSLPPVPLPSGSNGAYVFSNFVADVPTAGPAASPDWYCKGGEGPQFFPLGLPGLYLSSPSDVVLHCLCMLMSRSACCSVCYSVCCSAPVLFCLFLLCCRMCVLLHVLVYPRWVWGADAIFVLIYLLDIFYDSFVARVGVRLVVAPLRVQ